MIITENQLDEWVRGNAQIAQGLIVELIKRLVVRSAPNPKDRRFPLVIALGNQGQMVYLILILVLIRLCLREDLTGRSEQG